jgi:hypothetical protein
MTNVWLQYRLLKISKVYICSKSNILFISPDNTRLLCLWILNLLKYDLRLKGSAFWRGGILIRFLWLSGLVSVYSNNSQFLHVFQDNWTENNVIRIFPNNVWTKLRYRGTFDTVESLDYVYRVHWNQFCFIYQ